MPLHSLKILLCKAVAELGPPSRRPLLLAPRDLSVDLQEPLREVHHFGLVVDPQLPPKQQTNPERWELSLVGENLDPAPRPKPIHKPVYVSRSICEPSARIAF